jgi:cystathionine gamma-synthase
LAQDHCVPCRVASCPIVFSDGEQLAGLDNAPMHFETIAVHGGTHPRDEKTGDVAPPIHLSTTFVHGADSAPDHGYLYIRDANPNGAQLEEALAKLENGRAALAFSSGMAAAAAALQSLPPGAHVLLPDDSYYGVRALANEYFPRWGMSATFVGMEDLDAVRAAIRPGTRAIWAESPSNPLMKIVDLAALATIAHDVNSLFFVDNTFASPAIQRPLTFGADVVMHSTTKYLGGHSDVQGGALVFASGDAYCEAVAHTRKILGGVAAPFNSWLILRGIRSLAPRMRVHCANAHAIAAFLAGHPAVEVVHYPGLSSHPGHDIASRQMLDSGGMLSFRVKGGREAAIAVCAKVKLLTVATSLGGTETLIEHRASSEGPGSLTPQNLLRMSVGLEHPDDLIDDLAQALA